MIKKKNDRSLKIKCWLKLFAKDVFVYVLLLNKVPVWFEEKTYKKMLMNTKKIMIWNSFSHFKNWKRIRHWKQTSFHTHYFDPEPWKACTLYLCSSTHAHMHTLYLSLLSGKEAGGNILPLCFLLLNFWSLFSLPQTL